MTIPLATTVTTEDRAAVRRALPTALPWVRLLPTDLVEEFLDAYVTAVRTASDRQDNTPVWDLITRWRQSAEIYAAPDLYTAITAASGATRPAPSQPAGPAVLAHQG